MIKMKPVLIAICWLVTLVAAQDRDITCPTVRFVDGRVVIGTVDCTIDCLTFNDVTRCRECNDECERRFTDRQCPDIRRTCSLSCEYYDMDDNDCFICRCARPDSDGPTNDMCRQNYEQFVAVSGCRAYCVRRNDQGCFNCDRDCNDTSSDDDSRDECSPDIDCSEDRVCLAFGPSSISRCEQREMEGGECGRMDVRDFDFDMEDENENESDERDREESMRRDRGDEDTRTFSAIGGARDRSATRNLEQSAQVDRECETTLRCNTNRRCEQRPTGPCTMERDRNPDREIQCDDDDGMFSPLQCRRQQRTSNNDRNRFRCFCANRDNGTMIRGTERMDIEGRNDARIPDCIPQSFRNCSVQRNSRRLRVRHGEKVVRASDCMVCQCNDGQLEDCQSPRDSDVDCSKINPGSNPQSCQRRGMSIEHGQRIMVDDCNMCGCNNGRIRCTEVRQCMREGDERDEEEQACEKCRSQVQRIVSSTDGRNFPSRCAAMNCSRLRDDQLLNGPSSSQPHCRLYPCRPGFSCIRQGGRSCNRMEGCEPDDVRMCVERDNVTARVPMNGSRTSNPADRDGFVEDENDAVCGSDSRSYRSLANMVQEGPANVRVAFSGRCDREECMRGQVCGTDRVVYNSSCVLRSQSPNARVDYMGECMGMNMDRTTDEICDRVRENDRCNHTADNCRHLVSPTEGCCPVCGGIVSVAIDDEALDEHTRASGEDIDLDDIMRRMVQGGVIPQDIDNRCQVEATKTTTTRFSNVEITLNARNRGMDSEFCNMMSKEISDEFNNPSSEEQQPVQSSFVLAATDVPVVVEGAPVFAASTTLTIVAVTLLSLIY